MPRAASISLDQSAFVHREVRKVLMIACVSALARQVEAVAARSARRALLLLLATGPLLAQSHTLDVSQYLHRSWTAQEGFFKAGISGINSVAQTTDGYLWVPGTDCLLRFDGVRFFEWKPPANQSLPRKPLRRLFASKDGSLWIGGIGLAELKADGEFLRYHQLDGAEITGLIEDKDGGIWAGGGGRPESSKLCRFYHGQGECYPPDSSLGSFVWALHQDGKGQIWACTSTGLWRLRPGPSQQVTPASGTMHCGDFGEDASGTLIFPDGQKMMMLTADRRIEPYPIPLDSAWVLWKDREGDLWVGTEGQGIIHIHNGQTDRFTTADGLSSNIVVQIFEDREGNVWAATRGGLDKFSRPAIPSMLSRQGLANDGVNSVLVDHNGLLWTGTRSGLDRFIDGRPVRSTARLPSQFITSLFETSTGRMLVGTDDPNGMVWFDGDKVSRLGVATGGDVFGVAEDNRGDLWIASRQSGLLHLDSDGKLIQTFDTSILGKLGITLAYDAKRDGLWLTSRLGDLAFFKDGKFLEHYGVADGLGEGILRDPQVDQDGSVWVSTRDGLAHLRNTRISVLNSRNGLPCDAVHWMRHGRDHNVWLYTECGLVAISENELSAWIADPHHTVAILHYLDNTDGVLNVTVNGWYTPQTATTSDGRIVFAATGLSILDPRNLNQNSLPPPVHIEEITANERKAERSGHVVLPAKVRSVHIAFTALSFAAPQKVRFRYKLQGYDTDWTSPVSSREATYTNLPPGQYEFRVIACNNDGVWNTTGDTLTFYIPPAFYQAIWFWWLVAIAAACALWALHTQHMNRVTEEVSARLGARLQERERIARELHDTLLQDFQAVILRFQLVANRLAKGDPRRAEVEGGLEYADRVLAEGREQIRDLRADARSLDGFVESLAQHGQDLSHSWPLKFSITATGKPFLLYPVVRDEMYRISREAIGNAFRHSNGSAVTVQISYTADAFLIRICDDGQGIGAEILNDGRPGHWGISNMRDRAQKIGASIDFSSLPDSGTCLELKIPVKLATGSRTSWFRPKRNSGIR